MKDMSLNEAIERFQYGREVYLNTWRKKCKTMDIPRPELEPGISFGVEDGRYTNHGYAIDEIMFSRNVGKIAHQARMDAIQFKDRNLQDEIRWHTQDIERIEHEISRLHLSLEKMNRSLIYSKIFKLRKLIKFQRRRIDTIRKNNTRPEEVKRLLLKEAKDIIKEYQGSISSLDNKLQEIK